MPAAFSFCGPNLKEFQSVCKVGSLLLSRQCDLLACDTMVSGTKLPMFGRHKLPEVIKIGEVAEYKDGRKEIQSQRTGTEGGAVRQTNGKLQTAVTAFPCT